ncbi:hypothetical protein N7520_009049 [Penicillium odoratum]|uniref:uncharacterized protein n=1 Tax=Penicillium odoratum TaxID=1167516 RepID=UPI00254694AE|nr:uncharacterized protein N7520_009049 [Penicillium odoratum]KAJ5752132.1 hypothetical protein N7520_009049 [Penicillium odoratum]
MAVSEKRRIIIVGVGSFMSRSLALWLAGLGWNIALVSRTQKSISAIASEVVAAQRNRNAKVVFRTADAGQPASLEAALDWSVQQIGGKVDVLNYNAAHVAPSDILNLTPEVLEADFRVSALGTLIAGQWFVEHA